MDIQIIILFLIIGISTVMFITEIFSVDKIAFLVLVSLFTSGLLTGEEAVSGFSNPAVITIISLMIITAALEKNGSIGLIANLLKPIFKLPLYVSLPCLLFIVGGFSAFISTTAVVILFVRIMPQISNIYNISIEKYMMPISFAGILGGSCTLMGTSTNLIISQIAVSNGISPFSFFQITPLAICLLLVGVIVTTILSVTLLKKKEIDYVNKKPQPRYISFIKVLDKNPMIGKPYKATDLYKDKRNTILQIKRKERFLNQPSIYQRIKAGDILVLSTLKEIVLSKISNPHYEIVSENQNSNIDTLTGPIVELLILPDSNLVGRDFSNIDSSDLDGGIPLAINKHRSILNKAGRFIESRLSRVRVDPGDRLIIQLSEGNAETWSINDTSLIMEHLDHPNVNPYKKYIALGILLIVILVASFGYFTILESSLLGVGLLLITQSVTLQHAYQSINWQIIFLLVGLLPLGIALHNTGADRVIGDTLLEVLRPLDPSLIIGILFFTTMLISGVLSNNATAIIITPIAISLANGLGLNVMPFIVVIMLAANFSFFTPIGYQTNTIIYGMGIYRFRDFFIVGSVLSLVLWITAYFLIPIMFPF